jgi:hypothetical protein
MIPVLFNKEKLIFLNREMGYKNGQTRGAVRPFFEGD